MVGGAAGIALGRDLSVGNGFFHRKLFVISGRASPPPVCHERHPESQLQLSLPRDRVSLSAACPYRLLFTSFDTIFSGLQRREGLKARTFCITELTVNVDSQLSYTRFFERLNLFREIFKAKFGIGTPRLGRGSAGPLLGYPRKNQL